MLKPLTTDNLSPTPRHLRWKMNYSDNGYRVFPPKWGWFTRAHYLVLRKFSSRSLASPNLKISNKILTMVQVTSFALQTTSCDSDETVQMAWFPLQWVAQNSRRFNSILLNIKYFLEIAINTSAAPFLNSYVGCRFSFETWGFEVVSCNPCYLFYLCTRLSYSWWAHDGSHERPWDISTSHGHRN